MQPFDAGYRAEVIDFEIDRRMVVNSFLLRWVFSARTAI
jgi:hypothetical protein